MTLAPIVLFTYNRLAHTTQTVEALQKNILAADSELIIYSDGPKAESDIDSVNDVRTYLKTINGFKKITMVERDKNWGLANSIIDGVTSVINKYQKIIVVEDDLVSSPLFLTYMNEALRIYANEEKVISIHAYLLPVKEKLEKAFFIKGADCWGWATWKRGWDIFEADGKKLLNLLNKNKLSYQFDFGGTYPYTKMLKDQIRGKNSSWAIRWYASAFVADKLTLYPPSSYVHNIGNDGSGTHSAKDSSFDVMLNDDFSIENITIERTELPKDRQMIADYHRKNNKSRVKRILMKIGW